MDVGIPDSSDAEELAAQGAYYTEVFRMLRVRDDITSVTVWGLTDDRSWRSAEAPLLFDANRTPKPAFFGILASIDGEPDVSGRVLFEAHVDTRCLAGTVYTLVQLRNHDTTHLSVTVDIDPGDRRAALLAAGSARTLALTSRRSELGPAAVLVRAQDGAGRYVASAFVRTPQKCPG